MMKKIQKLAVLAMAFCLMLGTMAVSVFAYEYTMDVSSGNGKINGNELVKCTKAEPVTTDPTANIIKIDGEEVKVTPPDSDHFVIGLKEAGYDNGTLIDKEVTLADRKEDTHLVVAYGLKSDMVEYTINYVNAADGSNLLASETHYGVDGSKPVVAYKYVEGYLPSAYNETQTISKGGTNVFTFYYYEVDAEGNIIVVNDVVGGGAAAAGGGAGAGAGAGVAGAPGAVIGDGGVPLADAPVDTVDLDDGQTPTTDEAGDGTEVDGSETPKAGGISTPVKVAGAAAIIAAIAALVAAIARRNAGADDDDEEEDEE